MKTVIHNARLLDPASDTDAPGGIVFEGRTIRDAGPHLHKAPGGADRTIDANGLCLSPGLVDLRVKTGEPGCEHRETLATASASAVAGGITSMIVMPDTNPVIDDVALVQFIANRAAETAVNRVYPAGALTCGLDGEAMAEIGLMAEAGAVLFTNGEHPVPSAVVMKRIMQYAVSRNVLVSARAEERTLAGGGVINAGPLAGRMGLASIPRIAEWIAASRDLALAESTGARYLLDLASTGRTVEMVEEARTAGADVRCTVAAHHLFFNELDVGDYLTYCKVSPPFRAEEDRQSLIEAVRRGAVQAVVSAHDPQPPEEKRLPFAEAAFGAAGLETLLPAMLSHVHDGALTLLEALRPLTSGPADLMGFDQGRLTKGAPADFILFDDGKPWLCERENLQSRSTNSPFDGRKLQGKVLKTWVDGNIVYET